MNSTTGSVRQSVDMRDSESQSRFIQDRVTEFEKRFGDLCAEFVAYTRRTTKLRDNGDEIAKILTHYTDHERYNRTTTASLRKFAEHLAVAEDYRNAQVDRMVAKVVSPLASYGEECKHIKTNLRNAFNSRKRELSQRKKVDKTRDTTPGNSLKMSRAQHELEAAASEATLCARNLEKEILSFEKKKLQGTKKILSDFVQIEMMWHAKALETYSQAYNDLQLMDETDDLEDFRLSLHPDEATMGRLDRHRSASQGSLQSNGSLNRFGTLTTTNGRAKPPIPSPYKGVASAGASVRVNGGVTVETYSDEDEEDVSDYDDSEDYETTTGRSGPSTAGR